jgi:uncharacterized protein involved in tolerance to divalent cations/adenylate kinase family enzyme
LKIVFVTCPEEEAKNIAREVVRERLAAGATVVPGASSTFWWKSGIQNELEAVIIIRTEEHLLSKLLEQIRVLHPYEVPEVLAVDAFSVNPAYSQWLKEELGSGRRPPSGAQIAAAQQAAPQQAPAQQAAPRPAGQQAITSKTVRTETITDFLKVASVNPIKIVLIGPPGAGARSMGARIARKLMWTVFAPVEKLVTEAGFGGSPDSGDLISDDKILKLAEPELANVKAGGVVVGFPRTHAQADALAKVWGRPDVVFLLNLTRDQSVKRLKMRLSCNCGKTYGPGLPPRRAGICDACGNRLFHRKDDFAEEAVIKRYNVWNDVTKPLLLSTYVSEVYPIEASANYDTVLKEISKALTNKLVEKTGPGR